MHKKAKNKSIFIGFWSFLVGFLTPQKTEHRTPTLLEAPLNFNVHIILQYVPSEFAEEGCCMYVPVYDVSPKYSNNSLDENNKNFENFSLRTLYGMYFRAVVFCMDSEF